MKEISIKDLHDAVMADKYIESRQQYVDRVKKEGFTIYYPEPNELLLDIDSEENFNHFKEMFNRFNDELPYDLMWLRRKVYDSKTPGHKHISVKFPWNLTDHERILYQVLLGSDPVREMLSVFRIWNGDSNPTLLVRKEV